MATIYNKAKNESGLKMKIDRLVSIILLLLEKERIGAQALAEMFEVSPRTIYRDIETINMAGIPVRSISGVGGGFEIMEQYKIEKNVFSTTDLSSIIMGLSGFSQMMNNNELVNTLTKVKSFIPAEKAKDIALKSKQIHIDLSPWIGNRNIQTYLELIKTALQENRVLSFSYIDRHGNKTTRTVNPYQLVLKSNHWYFQGYCHDKNDFRLFKLSRISNLQLSEEVFSPEEFLTPQLEFEDILQTLQTTIKIRVHQSIMDRVLDFCPYEHFSPDGDQYFTVHFPFIENDYYYNILFGFGDKCECLEPSYIRREMKRRIDNIATLYQK